MLAAAFALIGAGLGPPQAEAAKRKLDVQLIAPITTKGKRLEAPVVLREKSARALKLRNALATLRVKRSQKLLAPNPFGGARVEVRADTLRAGDRVKGRGRVVGGATRVIPRIKGKRLAIVSRESRFSNDELADALFALSGQFNELSKRMDALEAAFRGELDGLKAQLAQLDAQLRDLKLQFDELLIRLAAVEDDLATLEADVAAINASLSAISADVAQLCAAVPLAGC